MADAKDPRYDQMRDEKAPTLDSTAELAAYIDSLISGEHTYNTCVPAMSLAAVAAFNLVAHKLGASGFQASCADLDVLRQTRGLEAGIVLDFADALYPQYDLKAKLDEALEHSRGWLTREAAKRLSEYEKDANNREFPAHPSVLAHWRKLAEAA